MAARRYAGRCGGCAQCMHEGGARVGKEVFAAFYIHMNLWAIEKHVTKGTEIRADEWRSYNNLDEKGYDVKRINKAQNGYGPKTDMLAQMAKVSTWLKIFGGTSRSQLKEPTLAHRLSKGKDLRLKRPQSVLGLGVARFVAGLSG